MVVDIDDLVKRMDKFEEEQETNREFRRTITIGKNLILWACAAVGGTAIAFFTLYEKIDSIGK